MVEPGTTTVPQTNSLNKHRLWSPRRSAMTMVLMMLGFLLALSLALMLVHIRSAEELQGPVPEDGHGAVVLSPRAVSSEGYAIRVFTPGESYGPAVPLVTNEAGQWVSSAPLSLGETDRLYVVHPPTPLYRVLGTFLWRSGDRE